MAVLEIAVMFLAPALIIYLTGKSDLLKSIGAITLCYLLGFVLAVLPLGYDKTMSQDIASVCIALAIPMVLFSFDLSSVKKLAGKTLFSFALVIVSTLAVSSAAAFIAAKHGLENCAAYAGMASGLYIGGTPNMFAVGYALLKDSTYISIVNVADSIIGGIYFLLVLTVLKTVYKRFLGGDSFVDSSAGEEISLTEEYDFTAVPHDRKGILSLVGVVLLAAACLGIGAGLEILINGNMNGSLYIMVTVSVLGILFSLIRPVRQVKGGYQLGQYLILVFSLGLSMSIDISKLASSIIPTFLFFTGVQIASAAVHFVLCRIFKIDGGIALITSIAGIYGPPFIAPAANAYGDKKLIAPGIICGTLGLILGNLLGIGLGTVLAFYI